MVEGWVKGTDGLEVNPRGVSRAGRRLGVTWPVSIGFMTADELVAAGRTPSALGFCAPSAGAHRIVLRRGLSAAESAEVLAHELAHAGQAEQLGSRRFDAAYASDGATLERQAWELAETVSDVEMVR